MDLRAICDRRAPRPPSGLAALPSDVLTEIFRNVPPHARIQQLSRVCRRWRTVSRRAVDRLPATFDQCRDVGGLRRALSLFPALTALRIPPGCAAECAPALSLFPHLRELHLPHQDSPSERNRGAQGTEYNCEAWRAMKGSR